MAAGSRGVLAVCTAPPHLPGTVGTEPWACPLCRPQVCVPSDLGENGDPGESDESPRVVSPVNPVTRDAWSLLPQSPASPPQLATRLQYLRPRGSVLPLPEQELSALDLQDAEEVPISRDACWPHSNAKPERGLCHLPTGTILKANQDRGALTTLLRSLPCRLKYRDSSGQEASLEQPTGPLLGAVPCTRKWGLLVPFTLSPGASGTERGLARTDELGGRFVS